MNNMWGFVDAIKQNLDEVAGIGEQQAASDDEEEGEVEEVQQQSSPPVAAAAVAAPLPVEQNEQPSSQSQSPPPPETTTDAAHQEQDEVASLRAQNTRLATAMGEALAQVNSQTEEIAQLRFQLSNNSKSAAASSEVAGLQQMVEQLKKEGIDLSKQHGRERDRARSLTSDKKQLEAKLEEAASSIEGLTALLAAEKTQVATLQGQTRKDAGEITRLETALRDRSQKETKAVAEAELAGRRIAEAESKEKDDLEQRLREQQEQYSTLESKFEELLSQRNALAQQSRSALVSAEQRVSQLERQVSSLSLRADMAEARVLETSAGMSDTVSEWGSRVRRSEQQLDDALAKNVALERGFSSATKEVSALSAQLEQARKNEESRAEQIVALTEEASRARRGVAAEAKKTAAVQQKLEDLEREMRRQEQHHVAEISRLQNEMLELARSPQRSLVAASSPSSSSPAANDSKKNSSTSNEIQQDMSKFLMSSSSPEANNQNGSAVVNTSRVEKELARLSAQLSDERSAKAALSAQLHRLRADHDVLLQLHGELLEQQSK